MKENNELRPRLCILDGLGRIVIPIGMRRELGLGPHSQVFVKYTNDSVVVTKADETHSNICVICHTEKELLSDTLGMQVCKECADTIASRVLQY